MPVSFVIILLVAAWDIALFVSAPWPDMGEMVFTNLPAFLQKSLPANGTIALGATLGRVD